MSVFVSYAHEDQKWARQLISQLSEKGIDVWDAPSKLLPGDNWSLEIGKALERAQAIIVLLSPAAVRSPNVRREIEYALASERFQDRLIPIVVKPTTKMPWILEQLKPVRGTGPSEVSNRVVRRLKKKVASG
jgi:TIR domain-containing protein